MMLRVTYITNNVLSLTHYKLILNSARQKENFLKGLCKKSSLISQANAKERNIFFNQIIKKG